LDELREHEELHKGRRATNPYACVLCESVFIAGIELRAHVLRAHEEGLSKCPDCSATFLTEMRMKRHLKYRHRNERRADLTCPICSYVASAPFHYRHHIAIHGSGLDFKCEVEGCEKSYKTRVTLRRHVGRVHERDKTPRTFQCTLCPKSFNQSSSLVDHQAHHSGIRAFMCEHCSRTFKSSNNLRTHYKVHEKGLPGRRVPKLQQPRKARLPPISVLAEEVQAQDQDESAVGDGDDERDQAQEQQEVIPTSTTSEDSTPAEFDWGETFGCC
jgi:hypothetical protein